MEALYIKATDVSPEVIFSPADGKYVISGWSRPESPAKFYAPVFDWIDAYGEKFLNNSAINLNVEYFNTPSARVIREMLDKLEKLYQKGVKMTVNWHYDDDSSKEEFEYEFAQGLSIPIKFVQNV